MSDDEESESKWQAKKGATKNDGKIYTIQKGKIESFDNKNIQPLKARSNREPNKQLFYIDKSKGMREKEQQIKESQNKLWVYKKPKRPEEVELEEAEQAKIEEEAEAQENARSRSPAFEDGENLKPGGDDDDSEGFGLGRKALAAGGLLAGAGGAVIGAGAGLIGAGALAVGGALTWSGRRPVRAQESIGKSMTKYRFN